MMDLLDPNPREAAVVKRAVSALAAALLLSAGCGSDEPAATDTTVQDDDGTTLVEAAGVPPTPTPSDAQAAELEAAVAAIYPDVPEGKAADWARSTCGDMLRDGLEGGPLLERIQRRFTGGDRPEPTTDQAQAILDAVNAGGWCR